MTPMEWDYNNEKLAENIEHYLAVNSGVERPPELEFRYKRSLIVDDSADIYNDKIIRTKPMLKIYISNSNS